MKRRSSWVRAALFVAAPLAIVSFMRPANAQGSDEDPDATLADRPTDDSTLSKDDSTRGPKAGSWLVDLRIPTTIILSDPAPSLQSTGLDVGIGNRVSKRWYVGGVVGAGLVWHLGQGSLFGIFRAGAEAHYIFHEGTASVSTNGDEGPYFTVPRYDWVGARVGVESLASLEPSGAFAELDFGTDARVGDYVQFGVVVAAGLSFEPAGAYGAAGATEYSGPPAPSSKIVSPYFTLGFHFGLGG